METITKEVKSKIISNVVKYSTFSDEIIIEYHLNKLIVNVLDYCNREALNEPLLIFIEDKLIKIAKFINSQILDDGNVSGKIEGVNIKDLKSISRGDTTITFKDGKNSNIEDDTLANPFVFTKTDYYYLNRHRKVYR